MPSPKLPKLAVELGCFYRDRAGYKVICFAEDEGTPFLKCMQVYTLQKRMYTAVGTPVLSDDASQTLLEEVRSDSPVFLDPTAEQATERDYDAMWERMEFLHCGIEISKFSPKTTPGDVKAPDMPSEIRNKLDRNNIGKLWRARLNKHTRWRYAWSIDRVVALALAQGTGDESD